MGVGVVRVDDVDALDEVLDEVWDLGSGERLLYDALIGGGGAIVKDKEGSMTFGARFFPRKEKGTETLVVSLGFSTRSSLRR